MTKKKDEYKIVTKEELKLELHAWSKNLEEFRTNEAISAMREKTSVNVVVNPNRVAQYLRTSDSHEYHEGLGKWIKKRK